MLETGDLSVGKIPSTLKKEGFNQACQGESHSSHPSSLVFSSALLLTPCCSMGDTVGVPLCYLPKMT